MASAMALMITSACLGLSGNPHEACEKALEAGTKQAGIEQNVDKAQKMVESTADRTAHEILGQQTMELAGGGIFIAKTVINKSVQFNVPSFGLCDKITSQVGTDKYSMQMVWRLP